MSQPSTSVQQMLFRALVNMQHSPNLSEDEIEWVRQFVMCLMTEFTVINDVVGAKGHNVFVCEDEPSVHEGRYVKDPVGTP